MDESRPPSARAQAWRLLLDFLANPGDSPMEFDELCSAHPHLADDLRGANRSAGHQRAHGASPMIATGILIDFGSPAEFPRDQDRRRSQQA